MALLKQVMDSIVGTIQGWFVVSALVGGAVFWLLPLGVTAETQFLLTWMFIHVLYEGVYLPRGEQTTTYEALGTGAAALGLTFWRRR